MKNTVILLWCSMCLALAISAGCEKEEAAEPEIILKLGHGLDITHPVHKAMVYMAKRVREKSSAV